MSIELTLIFLCLLQVYYGVLALKFITGAKYKAWQALLPFYNIYIMTKVIHRPWYWTILAILPVVGNVMMVVIFFELMHMYRIANVKNTILGVVTLGLYFGYLGYSEKLEYKDRDIQIIRKYISEGFASIVFAVVAATLIRAYTFEAFTIPTPSMERSMMVGDFLFVSKLQYGSRLPMTPFSLPLMHNKVPFTEIKAFTDVVQFPYIRLPKLSEVERNDPVVFNYPVEIEYPVDKREHYVKRCLGLPGDEFQVKNREIIVNGEVSEMPENAEIQFQYFVRIPDNAFLPRDEDLKERFDINADPSSGDLLRLDGLTYTDAQTHSQKSLIDLPGHTDFLITISKSKIDEFSQLAAIDTIFALNTSRSLKGLPRTLQQYSRLFLAGGVFPQSMNTNWTRDNYGPIRIPKAGETVELTINNYHLYAAIIRDYEGHRFEKVAPSKSGGAHQFKIDGKVQSKYTFEQNYYWMMGDNRHNSLDSRYWGFVPEDHIVGKPVFIWMSYDKYAKGLFNKIRTDRVFTTVNGEGERRSYFWPFVVVVVGITAFNRWRKRKKAKAA